MKYDVIKMIDGYMLGREVDTRVMISNLDLCISRTQSAAERYVVKSYRVQMVAALELFVKSRAFLETLDAKMVVLDERAKSVD